MLSTYAPSELHKEAFFKVLEKSIIKESALMLQVDLEPNWIDPIVRYLGEGVPADHKQA